MRPSRPKPDGRPLLVAPLAVMLAVALPACGDDTATDVEVGTTASAPAPPVDPAFAGADVQVVAEDVDFPTDRFTASAGAVTIGYLNEGRIRHTLVLEDVEAWDTLEVDEHGATDSGSIELEPGEYTLFCDVAGHRQAGMEAVLVVEG